VCGKEQTAAGLLKPEVYGSVEFIFTASRKTARNLGRGIFRKQERGRERDGKLAQIRGPLNYV